MMLINSKFRLVYSIQGFKIFSASIPFRKEGLFSYLRRYFSSDGSCNSSVELETPKGGLYERLVRVPISKDSVLPVLKKWVDEGGTLDLNDVRRIIKRFQKSQGSKMSLEEISEWMASIKYLNFKPGDAATNLDLMSKVYGIKEAEKHFNTIPKDSRSIHVYNALLNCYTRVQLKDKAEAIMQKIRKLGYAEPLAYSNMLKMYTVMGKQEKFNSLVQEMKEKGISFDVLPYSVQLHAYASDLDIARLEDLMQKMEADSAFVMDWDTYAVAANVYLKAGEVEKAKIALEKSEHLIGDKITTNGYELLMALYARMGSRDEVLRLWDVRKNAGELNLGSCGSLITSLAKLNDLDTAEKLLIDWKAEITDFDKSVVNCLVKHYCETGNTEKAELLVGKLIDGGHEPVRSTWKHIVKGYRECNKMEKAVDSLTRAMTARPDWRPDFPTLAECLEYLKAKGDVDGVKKIVLMLVAEGKLLRKHKKKLETRLQMKINILFTVKNDSCSSCELLQELWNVKQE